MQELQCNNAKHMDAFLARSTCCSQSRTGGSKIPSCTFQIASKEADKQAILWGEWMGYRAMGRGGAGFVTPVHQTVTPSVLTGLYHYKGLFQTLPLRFAKQPQDMAADAMTLTPQAVDVFASVQLHI